MENMGKGFNHHHLSFGMKTFLQTLFFILHYHRCHCDHEYTSMKRLVCFGDFGPVVMLEETDAVLDYNVDNHNVIIWNV